MKNKLVELAWHRHQLLEKIEIQRLKVGATSQHFQKPIMVIDIGLTIVSLMKRYPTCTAGGWAAIMALWGNHLPYINSLFSSPLGFALKRI